MSRQNRSADAYDIAMLSPLRQILEMIRFSHTLFALPFALLAAVMAWTTPAVAMSESPSRLAVRFRWVDLAGILICMVCARSAAMAFNRIADRRIDEMNPRTSSRHLVTGALKVSTVTLFTLVCSIGFVAGTLLFLPNRLPLYLSVPVLLFVFGYSGTKRFTALSHFWLGAALMLAPVSTWIAIRGQLVVAWPLDLLPAALLGLAVLLWVAGFDIIYACQDADFDATAKLHSVPVALGVVAALRVAALCHAAMVVILMALPWLCPHVPLGWVYLAGMTGVGVLLAYEHLIVRPDDLTRVNVAFFHVNAIVSLGLFVVGSVDLLT